MYISKFMTVAQVLREHPELADTFKELGLECQFCLSRITDTIVVAVEKHGLNLDDVLSRLRAECARRHHLFHPPANN